MLSFSVRGVEATFCALMFHPQLFFFVFAFSVLTILINTPCEVNGVQDTEKRNLWLIPKDANHLFCHKYKRKYKDLSYFR